MTDNQIFDRAVILHEEGKLEEAANLYHKILRNYPNHAAANHNLGAAMHIMGKLNEAEECYKKALELKPDNVKALRNLGHVLYKCEKFGEAEVSYKKAIALEPNHAEMHHNLASAQQQLGKLDEAETNYKKAIDINPNEPKLLYNFSMFQYYLNESDMTILQLEKISMLDKNDCGLKAEVNLAIFRFLADDFIKSREHLLASLKIFKKLTADFHNYKNYHNYLSRILNWHKDRPLKELDVLVDKKLYVIGESHVLASHGLRVITPRGNLLCKSLWILGCKQWHLGNSDRNKHKIKFESIISSLPKYSEILLSIGEIDCRLDEGIIKHNNKYPHKKRRDLLTTTVANYLSYIYKINSKQQNKITIQGVPCPNIDIKNISKEKVLELTTLIKDFNIVLKKKSIEIGFHFLDVYNHSNRGDGFSNKIWHIDSTHLSPEGMYEAWRIHTNFNKKLLSLNMFFLKYLSRYVTILRKYLNL